MNILTQKLLIGIFGLAIATSTQAAGYIKFDGVDGEAKAASGQTTGKRQHKPLQVTKPIDKNRPQKPSKSMIQKDEEPEPTGLLLPAIQKAR